MYQAMAIMMERIRSSKKKRRKIRSGPRREMDQRSVWRGSPPRKERAERPRQAVSRPALKRTIPATAVPMRTETAMTMAIMRKGRMYGGVLRWEASWPGYGGMWNVLAENQKAMKQRMEPVRRRRRARW